MNGAHRELRGQIDYKEKKKGRMPFLLALSHYLLGGLEEQFVL